MTHETMQFDFIIVGAGPAGLAAAIRLAQIAQTKNQDIEICVLEKGESVGANIISGAILEPRALNYLLPDWQNKQPPPFTPVTKDYFKLLTKKNCYSLPTPPQMKNEGNYIISLGLWCHWLAKIAESLKINIFPGFAASQIIFENNSVKGVITNDQGRDKFGNKTERFQPGIRINAKQTLFAEGCRGSLTEQLIKKFNLREGKAPQTYALGIKERWQITDEIHQLGTSLHTVGWPLPNDTYGGSFLYHTDDNQLEIGFITGLDYKNPWLSPFKIFQQWKTHPAIASVLKDGKRIAYGARSLNEGGYQSLPKLVFPGGALIGCAAGFLNVAKLKGIHTAMQSGILAAESIITTTENKICDNYEKKYKQSWIHSELQNARNIRPAMRWGLLPGLMYAAIDTYLFKGHAPWTFNYTHDHKSIKLANTCAKPRYLNDNEIITFDLMSSVWLTNLKTEENQPTHLKLKNNDTPININLKKYAGLEQHYCPAGVYEFIKKENQPDYLQINAANCIHCKACDIKDPTQNITWTPPENGCGPRYEKM